MKMVNYLLIVRNKHIIIKFYFKECINVLSSAIIQVQNIAAHPFRTTHGVSVFPKDRESNPEADFPIMFSLLYPSLSCRPKSVPPSLAIQSNSISYQKYRKGGCKVSWSVCCVYFAFLY